MKIHGGIYVGIRRDGKAERLAIPRGSMTPDWVICRRVADFPPGVIPADAAFTECTRCGERVAFNPHAPHLERPRVCMQCAGFEPDPIV
jgi:hypothetical protein